MNYEKKKKELVAQFNQNNAKLRELQQKTNQAIAQLNADNHQITGKLKLLEEISPSKNETVKTAKIIQKDRTVKEDDKKDLEKDNS